MAVNYNDYTKKRNMGLNYDPTTQQLMSSLASGQTASQATGMGGGSMASTAGSGLMAAGAIPTPASPFLIGAGLALQAGGGIYNAVKGNQAEKRQQEVEDREWNLKRRMILQELGDKKKKEEWQRGFMRTLLGGGANG